MPVFSSIAAAFTAAAAWLASGTLAAQLVTNLIVAGLTAGLATALGNKGANNKQAGDPGVRLQLPPATENKIPVLYGRAITGGIVTHANITNQNETMTYVVVLSEETGNNGNGNTTFSVNQIWRNDEKLTLDDDGAVSLVTDADGNTSSNIAGKIRVAVYQGSSANADSQIYPTTNKVFANSRAQVLGIDGGNMTGLVYATIEMDYDPGNNLVQLGTFNFDMESDLYEPSNVLLDYCTSTRYGAGLSIDDLDTASLDDMRNYSLAQVEYTHYEGYAALQDRWRIDGLISTYQTAQYNIDQICQAAATWFSYNPKQGKFSTIPNRAWTTAEKANAFVLSDDNIVSSFDITTTELYSLYNVIEAEHPQYTIRDQTEVAYVEIAPAARNPNEPENKLVTRYDLVNDNSRVENLANIDLKQSRFSTVLEFTADYSAIQVDVGDVVKVNNAIYSYVDELFRVIRVDEVEGAAGDLKAKLVLLEYTDAVYDHTTVLQKAPPIGTGIINYHYNPDIINANNLDFADRVLNGFGNDVIQGYMINVPDLIAEAEFVDLRNDLSNVEANVALVEADVANVTADVANIDIAQVESDLANVATNVSTNANNISTLNSTTIPNLEANISTNSNSLVTLNTVTIPGLNNDLANTDANVTAVELELANAATYPITTTDISANAITTPLIATNAVTALKIAAGTITASEIGANTITAANMLTGTLTANEIAAGTITGNEIAAGTITASDIQAGTITATQIAASTITSAEIAAGTIVASDIQSGTITSTQIAAGTITGVEIQAGSITTDKLGALSITASQIGASAVTTSKLDALAVTAVKIAAGAVTTDKMTANTINANRLTTGTISADKIQSGTSANNAGLIFGFGAGISLNGVFATGMFASEQANTAGLIVTSSGFDAILAATQGAEYAVSGYGGSDSSWTATSWDYAGTLGYNTNAGFYTNYANSRQAILVNSTYAGQFVGNVFTSGSYLPFTGAHEGMMHNSKHPDIGDIMVDVEVVARIGVSDTLCEMEPSTVAEQKGAVGVYTSTYDIDYVPESMANITTTRGSSNMPKREVTMKTEHGPYMAGHRVIMVNSVGEGQINVVGENGNISIGDLIVTSNTDGKGMKQSDDLVRGITVAKSRENVTFSSPSEEKMIACIYMSG